MVELFEGSRIKRRGLDCRFGGGEEEEGEGDGGGECNAGEDGEGDEDDCCGKFLRGF